MQFFIDNFRLLKDAFLTTLSLSLLARVLTVVLGTLLAAMRVSSITPLRGLSTFYVETFRNTPLTVVFFFMIFGLPQIDFADRLLPRRRPLGGPLTAAFVARRSARGSMGSPPARRRRLARSA